MKAKIIYILLLYLFLSDKNISSDHKFNHQNGKPQLNQFSQIKGNQLEVINYMERRGELNSRFGSSIAGIGDINGDGYEDVIVGNGYNGAGEALIYFGGAIMDSIPDIILRGEYEGDGFGYTVASGGDINGDGEPDFIVVATNYPNRKGKGCVYIYFGGTVLDTIPDIKFIGEQKYSNLGMRIAVGDVNGDQCNDILTSAPNYASITRRGKAYLYFGGAMLDSIPDWTNQGDTARFYFGDKVAIGDVNGDRQNDLLFNNLIDINELGNDYLVVTEIYFNHAGFDTVSDFSLTDSSPGNSANQILLCNDCNLDGADDFIIHIDFDPKTNIYTRIFFGGTNLDSIPDACLLAWPGAGINRLANAGDVNGDGWPDILAGFYHSFYQTASVGLYLGSEHINPTVDWTAGGGGYAIDGAGDVNGDGFDDLIVSMNSSPFTSVAWGAVWILAGNSNLTDIGTGISTKKEADIIRAFNLYQNYPNPFNNTTTIKYRLTNFQPKNVSVTIYELTGKEVITLVDQQLTTGDYQVRWNGTNQQGKEVSSGVYLCRLSIGQFQKVKKLILLK